ncbi:glycosyltransferase [Flavobacterium sp.]|uniref:glycosyltransferase n=1 Tax=Flavobacterium sp. TaxID=239 RepID=UPI000ED3BBC6|nr:glycosyltransferase [Flavobacterium sp.]HCQ13223.1 hypothetical protein [Flavobacterium sp.]
MNNTILVSVVMITYKHEAYIKQAIEGVLMQETAFDYELIISDDCSPDATEQIVKEIINTHPKGNCIKYFRHEKNIGMQKNGAFSLEKGKSKYLAICEGDDYWIDPLKLQKQVDFLETNTDFGLIFTDADLYYQESKKTIKSYDKTFKRTIPTGYVLNVLVEGNPYKTCTSLFRHKFIADVFEKNILNRKGFGDKSLWLHIASKSKVAYISDSTSVYRILDSSASHFRSIEQAEHFFEEVYNDSIENAVLYNIPIDKKKLRKGYYQSLITYCLEKNKYKELLTYWKKLDIRVYLFAKEKIVRPVFKVLIN